MWGPRRVAGASGLLGMTNKEMSSLLGSHGMKKGGTREELGARIVEAGLLTGLSLESEAASSVPVVPEGLPVRMDSDAYGTKVVNVKVEFIRKSGYNNLEAWCADPNNVYIGRRGNVFIDGKRYPAMDSIWHNPFKVAQHGEMTLHKYVEYMKGHPVLERLEELRGKNLGCWCVTPGRDETEPNAYCHGHILLALLNSGDV